MPRVLLAMLAAASALVPARRLPWALPSIATVVAGRWLKKRLDRPSRPYDRAANSVGREYDAWTKEGILEHYWGEHIHLGYYTDAELDRGYLRKDFIEAKYNFTQRMMDWGGVTTAKTETGGADVKILDVGCGIGGTSRYMATTLPESSVTGITLSGEQRDRATKLAAERDIPNAKFQVMDALNMDFEDNSFDVVWGCESGEHMPDKKKYVTEMARVLKPGGKMVIATWCQRQRDELQRRGGAGPRLYSEWTHPYFISIPDYAKSLKKDAAMVDVETDDWNKNTIASWRHSIWVGVFDPWPVIRAGPRMWYKCLRDGICLERMHRAFKLGLMDT
ncbi:sterol 24-C-methyltransferase [Aureococcus anophagefferens]|nr:sterol 24-C-methyltransferase [Aureococcus anophagefferens]